MGSYHSWNPACASSPAWAGRCLLCTHPWQESPRLGSILRSHSALKSEPKVLLFVLLHSICKTRQILGFFLVFPPKKKDRPQGISSDHRLKQQRHALTDAPLVSRELCSAYKFYWQLFSQTSEVRLSSIPGQTPILLHLNFLNLITLVPFLLFKLLEELEMTTFVVLRSTTGRKCCSSAT